MAARFLLRIAGVILLLIALAWLWVALPLPAKAYEPPSLDGYVVDTAGKLAPQDVDDLDRKLDEVRRTRSVEIVVFLVGSLNGEDIDDVAYDTFNRWGIGQKETDNGVLLLIAPNERRVRIETGRGVGGALTDLQS